jgi:hypothetical protein
MGSFCSVLLVGLLGNLCGQKCETSFLRVPTWCADGKVWIVPEPLAPKPGDMIFFRAYNPLENTIYFFSCAGGVTHMGIVVQRPDGSLALLEAPGARYPVMLSDIPSRLASYNGRIWIRRLRVPLTPEQCASLTAFASAQEAKRFDLVGLVRPIFGVPWRRPGTGCTDPSELDQPRWFCSSLTMAACIECGLVDPCAVRVKYIDPQDMFNDKSLNLCPCWEKPLRWQRCGRRQNNWWWSCPGGCSPACAP